MTNMNLNMNLANMNLDCEGRDQIEFLFNLTFEKVLHIPKQVSEIQILWTRGKMKGRSSIATVHANTATWDSDVDNSIKVVSSLSKDSSSSSFLHKSLILEIVAVHNKKIISRLSHGTLNLAAYVFSISDQTRPSAMLQIHEKMAQGCVACFGITTQFLRAKCGDWHPAKAIPPEQLAKDQEMLAVADFSAKKMKDEQGSKVSVTAKNIQISGSVCDDQSSVYIGDAGIELLLRLFSKYDCDRSGLFQIEHVACILQEIGQISIAQDLRSGKAALTQNLDVFPCADGDLGGAFYMTFSSFVSWISANRLLSKLQVFRSIKEANKESIRDSHSAVTFSGEYSAD
jgi:hypothetical protein